VALQRTLVTQHQEHALFGCNPAQPLTDRISLAQQIRVVVKEEHPHAIDSVTSLLEWGRIILPSL
jgi:hypothetical protein